MSNQHSINRVEAELNQWRSREERFTKIFPTSLSSNRSLLKEKSLFYESVAIKYKDTLDQEERFALRMLKQERNTIEKQLYPNLMVRVVRRMLVAPLKQQAAIRKDAKQFEQNFHLLTSKLQRSGFTGFTPKLEESIKLGQQQFTLPVSYYISDKERLDHQLTFTKDQTGQYQFEGYLLAVHNVLKPEENKQQYFSMKYDSDLSVLQAYNLLSGRSVQKNDTWVQFDFSDKDAQGNYRIKEFKTDYGYDIETTLQRLPLKELLNKGEFEKLMDSLKQGSRQSVSFLKDGKEQQFYIEANPQFKSVNIYDEYSRKITLTTALGNRMQEALKLTTKLDERHKEALTKRNSMRIVR